ncbi:MAG: M15 family metallopeptidase [Flavobacteriaceae bacterium]|nr:M15 family metallopeptidase [Flavobacteriaceae bacterium]
MLYNLIKFKFGLKRFIFLCLYLTFSNSFSQTESKLVDLKQSANEFVFDIRYATSNNFTKEVLYDCEKCLLLPEVAEALKNANYYFCDRGYKIKIFDCYRPLSVQKKMWTKLPNPIYVADPAIGSIHNRAAAVDLTLITLDGKEIDMGTDYDFFGKEAHIDNYNLPKEVIENRKILQEGMIQFGFATIQSEWWHFYSKNKSGSPILDIPFVCEN